MRRFVKQESLVNQKCESRSSGSGCTSRFPLMVKNCMTNIKKGMTKGKLSNDGGSTQDRNSL